MHDQVGNERVLSPSEIAALNLPASFKVASTATATGVPPGGGLTTDPTGVGATPTDPVQTTITSPSGGDLSITTGALSGSPPAGYAFLGHEVEITADPATETNPLVIQFELDQSTLGSATAATLQIFRNGVVIPDCPGATQAVPDDPCVSDRTILGNGNVRITILTSHASHWNFGTIVDATPPDTSIDTQPANPTNQTSASFTFTATETATFECDLDGGEFAACTSPQAYTSLSAGSHTFQVRATDTAGNTDPTPASYTWTIDTTPPETTIDTHPANPSTSATASFTFSANETSTFECELDSGAFAACTSPQAYASLSAGSHTFQVRATDTAGNTDASPASFTWTVDTTPPETTIDTHPANPSTSATASFTFSASETATFRCQLDAGGFSACTSPKNYTGLADGSHTFQVRATDTAGNTDPSPASFTWTIDTTPPDTSIDSHPANPTTLASATFTFSANEASTFECRLDGGSWAACSSPTTYTNLAKRSHTFDVRATDHVGNTETSPAMFRWTNGHKPKARITGMPPKHLQSTSAQFTFTADDPGATFQCSLDGAAFTACTSPKTYTGLAPGKHTFRVKAFDAANRTSKLPTSYSWKIT